MEIVQTTQAKREAIERDAATEGPAFFHLRARLPKQGRTESLVAATDQMWIILKTYAEGGENELHAHPHQDHAFVVLQGRAEFYGPGDERKEIGKHEGVMLPRGTFYWFKSTGDEPLVMIRIGSVVGGSPDYLERIDIAGNVMLGESKENKKGALVLGDEVFE